MSQELKETLRRRAREVGLDLFGVAPARPASTGDFFVRWLEQGRHGTMEYLARRAEVRLDPGRLLPGARSVVAVGLNYHIIDEDAGEAPPGPPPSGGPSGRVARYAWGRDYHRVMGSKLKALARTLVDATDGAARTYVDTGPVLERDVAARAGLGWFGKNTNLLREGLGSWFFLGVLITDRELPPDDPVADRCGTCTACLDACPTDALPEPYLLDSNLCISYLTIEHRGTIPAGLREPVGDWVFGCDICQDVCPWNREAPPSTEPDFAARPGVPRADLVALLRMTEEQWQLWFRGSAVKRATRRGLRRNAAVALGNAADPRTIPALIEALGDDDPLLRGHVAWALGRLGDAPTATAALRAALDGETEPAVRSEIEAALGAGVDAPAAGEATR